MAEADRFLCGALAQSGCLPESTAESVDLKELTSDAFVSIVWRCLAKIQEAEPHLAFQVPDDVDAQGGVAARHRVGSQLANILKELGYAGDCGYNHFLYPNEKESRSILSWLVGKLPTTGGDSKLSVALRTATTSVPQTSSTGDCLADHALAEVFSAWMKRKVLYLIPSRDVPGVRGFEKLPLRTTPLSLPWFEDALVESDKRSTLFNPTPPGTSRAVSILEAMSVAQRRQAINLDNFDDVDDFSAECSVPFGGRMEDDVALADDVGPPQTLNETGNNGDLSTFGNIVEAASIPPFFVSAAGALKENAMAQLEVSVQPQDEIKSSEETSKELLLLKEEAAQADLESIHIRLIETQQRIDQVRDSLEKDQDELLNIQSRIEEKKAQGITLKKEIAMKRQILGLLPQATENVMKLEAICAKNEIKLDELAAEWEAHKRPFEAEEQRLLSMKSNRKARCRQLVAEMKTFRVEMKEMVTAIQEKMDALRALDKAYAKLPQNINRNSYTNRIMDIIKQVHKQKQEIGRIIEDIKSIQKQLNFSSEKLKRSEAVTEEKLFGEASKQVNSSREANNPYVECYRKFAQVRELFEELILVVGDVGKKENSARDLENWITQLQGRDSSEQLDRVLADLQSVRQENAALNEQLKALRVKH